MQISQKKLLYGRTLFDFQEKELHYTISGERQTVKFAVPYQEISVQKSMERFAERSLRYVGRAIIAAVFLGYIESHSSLSRSSDPVFFIIYIMALAAITMSRFCERYDATKIPVLGSKKIIIFQDDQHQAILDEIDKRRKAAFRCLHAEVDTLNHPEAELKKFLWLKKEDIISSEEFNDARQKIIAGSKNFSPLY